MQPVLEVQPSSPSADANSSGPRKANVARQAGAWVQLIFFIGLFVLWLVRHWKFTDAVECCVVGGMLFYSGLNVYAALVTAWSGPVLLARVSRLVAVLAYLTMRYILHMGFWHSLLTWAVLWLVAGFLVGHSRRRAVGGTPLKVAPLKSDRVP